jgi:polyisoprenoid-binding protein YceI
MRARIRLAAASLLALLALVAGNAAAAPWQVDPERSAFVVLTHPEGLASGLAHPHVIVAVAPSTALEFDPAHPEATHFTFKVPVLALELDSPESRSELAPRLREVGALTEPLKVIAESTREKIRRDMLAADQLFAERFPEIRATLVGLVVQLPAGQALDGAFEAKAKVKIEIHGVSVEKELAVHGQLAGGELEARMLGELAFTEFGIKPYSAVLGTVRNADRFHLFVDLVARPAAPKAP